jgi:S-adenosylmethionine:tRNA ribosyltransferase-isomerase
MLLSDFDYDLPEELIAQRPLERRDASRMLVLNRKTQTWKDSSFEVLSEYVRPRDVIVINNTRVFPARLIGEREPSGGRVEVLLMRELGPSIWEALVRPAQRVRQGARLRFGSRLRAEVLECSEKGLRQLKFMGDLPLNDLINEIGETPLPPYIKRPFGTSFQDSERYQTVFAKERGAIAAPTAGLHFTPQVLESLRTRGTGVVEITLHVGYGTFEPIRVENIEEHQVAAEFFHISSEAAEAINDARAGGGRVIAIGTTTTRALESSVNSEGRIAPGRRQTELTVTPGFQFRVTDALLTNFHLPRSSLLLLICAFAGRQFTLDAYHYAVEKQYRFYSYGDCMLVI